MLSSLFRHFILSMIMKFNVEKHHSSSTSLLKPKTIGLTTYFCLLFLLFGKSQVEATQHVSTVISTSFGGFDEYFIMRRKHKTMVSGMTIDKHDRIYFVHAQKPILYRYSPNNGLLQKMAGSNAEGDFDGIGEKASFQTPAGMAIDSKGNLIVADFDGQNIRKLNTTTHYVSTVAENPKHRFFSWTAPVPLFHHPVDVAIGPDDSIYVADMHSYKIKKIWPNGTTIDFAGCGVARSLDGVGTKACFSLPSSIAIDAQGHLYVSEFSSHKIRKITPNGVVTTIAGTGERGKKNGKASEATFNRPFGLAVDNNGNVFVADTLNGLIRVILPAGYVLTYAGDIRSSAQYRQKDAYFKEPVSLALDSDNNLYVMDMGLFMLKKVSSDNLSKIVAHSHALKAEEYFQNQDYEKAVEEYNLAIDHDPENGALYQKRRLTYTKDPKYHDLVISEFERDFQLYSDSISHLLSMVENILQLENPILKESLIELAIESVWKAYELSIEKKNYSHLSNIYSLYMKSRILKSTFNKKKVELKSSTEESDSKTENEINEVHIPDEMEGPILLSIMMDPVKTPHKGVYDRRELLTYLKNGHGIDPLTRYALWIEDLQDDVELKKSIDGFLDNHGWKLSLDDY